MSIFLLLLLFADAPVYSDKVWVKRKLQQMVDVDQAARKQMDARVGEIDRANTEEMKKILAVWGWIKISDFGKESDKNAWLLVQHADHDRAFQRRLLEVLKKLLPEGETQPTNYAYLWDRVATGDGRPQRYGTQGRCKDGAWEPFDIEEPERLDERRQSMLLPSMEEYRRLLKKVRACD